MKTAVIAAFEDRAEFIFDSSSSCRNFKIFAVIKKLKVEIKK